MALIVKDRVLESCSSSGLATFTLSGAVTGYQRFSAIGNGNTTYYAAYVIGSNDWEVGIGTVGTSSLTRDTILSSSTGSKVNFAGNPVVWCDLPSSKAIFGDANNNISVNSIFEGFTSVGASGTQIVLTASSTPYYLVTGSGGQTIKLPDATTLPLGAVFDFNNNQSSGAITVNNNSNTLVASIPSGGYTSVILTANSNAAGTWDRHDQAPSNVSWSTNTFDYPGSITSATWNGSTIAYNRGGTGQSSAFVAGGVVYGSSTTALAVTAIGTTGQILLSNGASPPTWGNGVVTWQSVQTANFTAVAGNGYPVNTTSGAITVTLPASPTAGQIITILDYSGTASTNNISILPNGNKIQGNTFTLKIITNRQSTNLVYVDSTQGWVSYADQATALIVPYSADYLIVAGGGSGGTSLNSGGGGGGGGGAGGLLSGTLNLVNGTTYSFVIGAGGASVPYGNTNGNNGSNSTALGLTAIGGGGGAGYITNNGLAGGSGGGGVGNTSGTGYTYGGAGTTGQGFDGGFGYRTAGFQVAGGGGGASAVGGNSTISGAGVAGNGGAGASSSITGSAVTYAGGGGGGGYNGMSSAGSGGAGGGGAGSLNGAGTSGTVNTGGGGGGGAGAASGAGGSGVVILSVPTGNYTGTVTGSPTVTTSGGNTILKFTSSGSYTA
jgi:hypothetical protein